MAIYGALDDQVEITALKQQILEQSLVLKTYQGSIRHLEKQLAEKDARIESVCDLIEFGGIRPTEMGEYLINSWKWNDRPEQESDVSEGKWKNWVKTCCWFGGVDKVMSSEIANYKIQRERARGTDEEKWYDYRPAGEEDPDRWTQ